MLKAQTRDEALSPEDCDRLLALLAKTPLRPAALIGGRAATDRRRAEIAWLDDLPEAAFAMDRLIRLVAAVNRDDFGFEISDFGESAQAARYTAENAGHFDWHSDIGSGTWAAKRKLTVVVQLSAPADYDGGGLELRPDSHVQELPRRRGTALIFPSFTLHRVTPVSRGQRWSLTLWAHGPGFR